jgi:hypothetical protein
MRSQSLSGFLFFVLLVIGFSCKKESSKPPEQNHTLENIFSDAGMVETG